jgi:hypothetical protein
MIYWNITIFSNNLQIDIEIRVLLYSIDLGKKINLLVTEIFKDFFLMLFKVA